MADDTKKEDGKVDVNRRNFLKASVVASAALVVGGMAAIAKVANETGAVETSTSTGSSLSFPRVRVADVNTHQVANVNTLQVNQVITYYYPLDDEPNLLFKLGVNVENGVGPGSDIVSFSDICQHLGCNPGFVASGSSPPCNPGYTATVPVMYCCCHGSIYDMTKDASIIRGPTPRPVPRVILSVDSNGDIYATGMEPPVIWSSSGQHGPLGSNDVQYDLQGGNLVSTGTTST